MNFKNGLIRSLCAFYSQCVNITEWRTYRPSNQKMLFFLFVLNGFMAKQRRHKFKLDLAKNKNLNKSRMDNWKLTKYTPMYGQLGINQGNVWNINLDDTRSRLTNTWFVFIYSNLTTEEMCVRKPHIYSEIFQFYFFYFFSLCSFAVKHVNSLVAIFVSSTFCFCWISFHIFFENHRLLSFAFIEFLNRNKNKKKTTLPLSSIQSRQLRKRSHKKFEAVHDTVTSFIDKRNNI